MKKFDRSNLRFFRFMSKNFFSTMIFSFTISFSLRNKKSYLSRIFVLIEPRYILWLEQLSLVLKAHDWVFFIPCDPEIGKVSKE